VGDEPPGDVAHAGTAELDALRRRAYGADADIFGDPAALARLGELEDRVRRERFAADSPAPVPEQPTERTDAAPDAAPSPEPASLSTIAETQRPSRRAPRWHAGLVAAAAAVAVLLGGAAWSAERLAAADARAADEARASAVLNDERAAAYRASYRLYIDGMRGEVLTLPGAEEVAVRMIRDQLRPHGLLYGRTVGVGPTLDHRFCMIIADLPAASITCIPVENAYANPVTVLLPAWYADADSDLFTGLGEPVAYTLMPGGVVIAEPADTADAVFLPGATPAPTAVPPPGWQ
jgi:hypothetical protein